MPNVTEFMTQKIVLLISAAPVNLINLSIIGCVGLVVGARNGIFQPAQCTAFPSLQTALVWRVLVALPVY